MADTILVFAGTRHQYRNFITEYGLNDQQYRYVASLNDLRGRRGGHFVRVGKYYRHPVWDDAVQYLEDGEFIEDVFD